MTPDRATSAPRPAEQEPIAEVSADLAYELQAKMFEQLAAISAAGAGLTITLIGSILRGASPIIWLAVIEFAIAALVALMAQQQLVEGLFSRQATRRKARTMTLITIILIGMGIGSLGASVLLEGNTGRQAEARAAASKAG